jgi:hypothetical protein
MHLSKLGSFQTSIRLPRDQLCEHINFLVSYHRLIPQREVPFFRSADYLAEYFYGKTRILGCFWFGIIDVGSPDLLKLLISKPGELSHPKNAIDEPTNSATQTTHPCIHSEQLRLILFEFRGQLSVALKDGGQLIRRNFSVLFADPGGVP